MLQNLRNHVQGWIASAIAGVLCLAFALWGVEYYISGNPTQVVVAKVNGEEITQTQWDTAYNRARQSQGIQIQDPKLNETFQNQLKTRALNGLIQTYVLTRAAEKAGYIISQTQVAAQLQQMPNFQLNGQFSYNLFLQTLANLSYTPETFIQEIAKTGLLTQVQRGLAISNFVLKGDVDQNIVLQEQKRSFGYFLISFEPFLKTAVVTQQEIADYYKSHTADFLEPEKVKIQYLLLSSDEANKKIKITEQELAQYYEENKAAFAVAKGGKTTKQAQPATFATAKPLVEKALRQQKVEQWLASQSDKLANLTYTHPDTLKFAADALGLPIQTTGFFTQRGEKGKGLLANSKLLATAFSDSVLKQSNNSDVITIDDHTIVVLRVAEHQPATAAPLTEMRADIEKFLKRQAAKKAATALGETVLKEMQKGIAIKQIAAQHKLTWLQKNNISRTTKDVSPQLLQWIFSQPAPASDKKPIIDGKLLANEYAVVAINAVTPGTLTAGVNAQRNELQQKLQKSFGSLDYDLYLAQEMGVAKIKMESAEAKK